MPEGRGISHHLLCQLFQERRRTHRHNFPFRRIKYGEKTRGEIDESYAFSAACGSQDVTSLSRPCVGIQVGTSSVENGEENVRGERRGHAKTTCHDHVGADVTRGLEKSHDAPTCSTLSVGRGKGLKKDSIGDDF
ncbi:hypothetical protein YC2023_016188 [Brassica napus]